MSSIALATWTQFVRNLLCCMKSIIPLIDISNIAKSNQIYQYAFEYFNYLMKPLIYFYPDILLTSNNNNKSAFFSVAYNIVSKTTIIEYCIAVTQFAAVVFNLNSGLTNLYSGYMNYKNANKYFNVLKKQRPKETETDDDYDYMQWLSFTALRQEVKRDIYDSEEQMFIGFWECCFSVSFLFLTSNSLHIEGPGHPKMVIDALIVMEIGLLYLLYHMFQSILWDWDRYIYVNDIRNKSQDNNNKDKLLSISDCLLIGTKTSFRVHILDILFIITNKNSDPFTFKKITTDSNISYDNNATKNDFAYIKSLLVTIKEDDESDEKEENNDDDDKNKNKVITKEQINNKNNKEEKPLKKVINEDIKIDPKNLDELLLKKSNSLFYKILHDILFLIINFIAGYGYLMGVIVYYFPLDGISEDTLFFIRLLLLNFSYPDADWYGNFAGDLAWTVEPFLIIVIFYYNNVIANKEKAKRTEAKKND